MNKKYADLKTNVAAEKAIYEIICEVYSKAPPEMIYDRVAMKKLVDDELIKEFDIKLLDLIVVELPKDGGKIRCRFWTYGPSEKLIGIFV